MLFFASWTLQTVTAGNGISQIGVGTVSKETNIGFRFHFSTNLTLKKAPADKARPQPTIQKAISTQWPMAWRRLHIIILKVETFIHCQSTRNIDAQGGRGEKGKEGVTHFIKLGHKNALKHKNRRPPRFSHNPSSRELENDCASMTT